jgi:hypothetical protein
MEISGNIIQVLALQTGEGKNGQWKKQEFIIETEGTYPKKVCVAMWGEWKVENITADGIQM